MELIIVILIFAILAAIAVPSYLHYVRKSQYKEVVQTAHTLKSAVAECVKRLGKISGCSGGNYGIPPNIVSGRGMGQIDSISVTDGVITVTPQSTHGFTSTDTYILTPNYNDQGINWTVSGGACKQGYASDC